MPGKQWGLRTRHKQSERGEVRRMVWIITQGQILWGKLLELLLGRG